MTRNQLYEIKEILHDDCPSSEIANLYDELKELYYNVLTRSSVIFMNERSYNMCLMFKDIFLTFPEEIPEKYKDKKLNLDINMILYDDFIMRDLTLLPSNEMYMLIEDIALTEDNLLEAKKYFDKKIKSSYYGAWCMYSNLNNLNIFKKNNFSIGHIKYITIVYLRVIVDKINKLNVYINNSQSSIFNDSKVVLAANTLPINLEEEKSYYNDFDIKSALISYKFQEDISDDIKTFIKVYQKDKLVVEPYVFLPMIKTIDCYNYCKNLLNKFGQQIPDYIDINDNVLIYKYTQRVLSQILLKNYLMNTNDGINISYDSLNSIEEKIIKYLNDNVSLGSFQSSKYLSDSCYTEDIFPSLINLSSTDKVSHKIGEVDGYVSNMFSISSQTYRYFYDKDIHITHMLLDFFAKTKEVFEHREVDLFCKYLDKKEKTDKYSKFFNNVCRNNFFYDSSSLWNEYGKYYSDEVDKYISKKYTKKI